MSMSEGLLNTLYNCNGTSVPVQREVFHKSLTSNASLAKSAPRTIRIQSKLSECLFALPCHRRRYSHHQSIIQGFWQNIVRSKPQIIHTVQITKCLRRGFFCPLSKGIDRCEFHGVVDAGCAHIERISKYERKRQHVIDPVGVIRPFRGNDQIVADAFGRCRVDFRIGIGIRKDHGFGSRQGELCFATGGETTLVVWQEQPVAPDNSLSIDHQEVV